MRIFSIIFCLKQEIAKIELPMGKKPYLTEEIVIPMNRQ